MPSPIRISVQADLAALTRRLNDFERKQLPFASAQALTAVAKRVQAAEKAALPQVFDRPTPFTVNSIGVKAAKKNTQEALVFVKDIAAAYLAPYEFGGTHKLIGSGKTWLNPKDMALLNQYGNFSRAALKRLEGRPDIFVGSIKTKSGESIGGVWQRPTEVKAVKRSGKRGVALRGVNKTGHLKLLIRFGDAQPVRQHLDFGARARNVVAATYRAEFAIAFAKALATARR
ncbi:hypothetical protein QCE62_19645 [Caballeronia sp. LZ033]|uniref:hypothetical protein n=1 Tax=Caballeronia sp. LZ033 TaxID=3038566 RepID=UPI002865B8D1|nr:hypothetical protein [Caballeronia sp. LZ033]MDR5815804.1 hypothetical protein [Caballeronia sp. LZ033]